MFNFNEDDLVDQQEVPSISRKGTESGFWKELEKKKTNKKRKQVTANILGLPKGTKSTLVIFYSEVSPPPKRFDRSTVRSYW